MTYEQKAKEIALVLSARLHDQGINVPGVEFDLALITTALREAGNAKLEEAACAFHEKHKATFTGKAVAAGIRSLVEKD